MKKRLFCCALFALTAAMTGCSIRSAKLIMPDVNQPVVMGRMIGINAELPPDAWKDGFVFGEEGYEQSDNYIFGWPISSTDEYSNIQPPLLKKLGLSQNRCVTNLSITVDSIKSRGLYTFNESVNIGYNGEVYKLYKSGKKE